jgi:hypothetical protein
MGSALVAHADPSTEVKAAFTRYDEGWRNFDVAEVLAAMAPEFEWTNSVGIRIVSKPQFETFLKSLFKNPRFRAGKSDPACDYCVKIDATRANASQSQPM